MLLRAEAPAPMTVLPAEPTRPLNVLVTGGAGYIGSHTAHVLADRGHRPVILDDLGRGERAAVRSLPLIVGDVADRHLVAEALGDHRIDVVVHFAALKSVEESLADPVRYFRVNVGGTVALLEAMASVGVPALVLSSSCAVYGLPASLPVDEAAPFAPANPYGESKAMAERAVAWTAETTDLRAIRLRYFNAAGAALDGSNGERLSDASNLIPIVMAAALGLRPEVTINGTDYQTPDGTAIRDYVHVLDLAEAHVRAVEHLASGGPSDALNVGTGQGASVREIVELVRAVSGRPIPSRDGPRRPGDPAAVWAATDRAASVLAWQARHDLRSIVESAWRWHVTHPDGFGSDPARDG